MITVQNILLSCLLASASWIFVRLARSGSRGSKLRGPPRGNLLLGQSKRLREAQDNAATIQEEWTNDYGSVFKRPGPLGSHAVILTDPKAIAHFYSEGESLYDRTSFSRRLTRDLLGHGILTAVGDDHKRQRRALAAGFSIAKTREYTSIFLDLGHKVKAAWDAKLEDSDAIEEDVTSWMNAVSLDSMGLASFSHDFGHLKGEHSDVADAFEAMGNQPFSWVAVMGFLLSTVVPALMSLPTTRNKIICRLRDSCKGLARKIIADASAAEAQGDTPKEKSIIGLLLKSRSAETGFPMTEEEVGAQMRTLILAGYETTAVSMTWGLIELARRPDIQIALRNELREKFPDTDPTWDQLTQGLPLLDAVIHETLRLHSPVVETIRQPVRDDIVPLSAPITLADGKVTDQIVVPAGQTTCVPIAVVNRIKSLWGEDAWEFKPERWLNDGQGIPASAKELQGHRHLITFVNGPRTCLGKHFALAEFSAVLAVLVKNFVFELPDGPKTVICKDISLMSRPAVEGRPRCNVPMRITRAN